MLRLVGGLVGRRYYWYLSCIRKIPCRVRLMVRWTLLRMLLRLFLIITRWNRWRRVRFTVSAVIRLVLRRLTVLGRGFRNLTVGRLRRLILVLLGLVFRCPLIVRRSVMALWLRLVKFPVLAWLGTLVRVRRLILNNRVRFVSALFAAFTNRRRFRFTSDYCRSHTDGCRSVLLG